MIKSLTKELAEDLCAQQVITSLCDCVKELVDNAIDAGATRVQIALKDYGKKSLSVTDNGCGIESFQFLGKKGSTSKNKGDHNYSKTLGFRGEALHSLAKVSQGMTITTTPKDKPSKSFDMKQLVQENVHPRRANGTIVLIDSLFELLPVRRYELLKKYKDQLRKIDEMVREYCLIYPEVIFFLKNTREGKEDALISVTAPSEKVEPNLLWSFRISEVLGPKFRDALIPINTQHLRGWILKNIESGSSRENGFIRRGLHYMYLNKRPIDPLPRIQQTLNDIYKRYNKSTKIAYILDLILPWESFDVNLAPNKRQILIKEALVDKILEELKAFIDKNVVAQIVELNDGKNLQAQRGTESLTDFLQKKEPEIESKIKVQNEVNRFESENNFEKQEKQKVLMRRKSYGQAISRIKDQEQGQRRSVVQPPEDPKKSLIDCLNKRMSKSKKIIEPEGRKQKPQEGTFKASSVKSQIKGIKIKQPQIRNEQRQTKENPPKIYRKQEKQEQAKQDQKREKDEEDSQLKKRTTHSLKKEQFQLFEILGQFNRGFIVCYHEGNFYLVDQHAASEKFNFQKLMAETRNKTQVSEKIKMTGIQLQKLEEQRNSLEEDGFKFQIIEEGEVILTIAPVFLGKVYGSKHFLDLIQKKNKLEDQQEYYMAAATKACRKAVMVGDVLQKKQMITIVKQLSKLQSPWNCPHGRPTLISLGSRPQIEQELIKNEPSPNYELL